MACSHVVAPLSSAPGAHSSGRDNEGCDIHYSKGIRNTIRSIMKLCKSCQVNKRHILKFGHLPSKIVIRTPWEALCGNLVGPNTLKGLDKSAIDFMALTMIDPASSWFEIVKLPLVS